MGAKVSADDDEVVIDEFQEASNEADALLDKINPSASSGDEGGNDVLIGEFQEKCIIKEEIGHFEMPTEGDSVLIGQFQDAEGGASGDYVCHDSGIQLDSSATLNSGGEV